MSDSGRTLAERYRLTSHLARGGMADVFEAEDTLLRRRVAVKVLHAQYATDAAFVARFQREAQAAANLSHPNIVAIFDSGRDEGTHFIVMELIEGRTLRDILKGGEHLLPRRCAEIGAEVAAALEVAHRSSLIHRDLKPGNIMLSGDGSVKVTDFGIARALDDSEELTKTGAVIGTATYFSPEQAQGLPADERSDVYALGIVLYEMLTGIPPFSGESPVAVAYQHVSEYAEPPSELNHDVPAGLDAIVMRAMEKDPDQRYQSAAEIRADLLRFLSGNDPAAASVSTATPDDATRMMEAPPATVPPAETARAIATASQPREHNQNLFILGVVAAVVTVLLGAFFLVSIFSGNGDSDLVAVPRVAGLSQEDAREAIQNDNLRVQTIFRSSDTVDRDFVIETDPPEGTQLEPDSTVRLVVSSGPDTFPLLNLVGETEERARQLLDANNLVVNVTYIPTTEERDIVLSQDPAAGSDVAPGSVVNIEVSASPDTIIIPDLSGLTEANAKFQIALAGLEEDDVIFLIEEDVSDEIPEGFVVRTDPPTGLVLPKGGTLTLFISTGPGRVVVPLLVGKTVAEAQALVAGLDIQLVVSTEPVLVLPGSPLENLIATQNPQPDIEVEVGSSVTVALGEVPKAIVPDLTGKSEAAARAEIELLGLVFEVVGTTPVPAEQVGTVLSQTPTTGTELVTGDTVTVIIGGPIATTTTVAATTTTPTTTP
ncbi:MAG: Stk1 family PASTA domain-containing Ser/Thr kinase [Acidimicrobiia bacterium]